MIFGKVKDLQIKVCDLLNKLSFIAEKEKKL